MKTVMKKEAVAYQPLLNPVKKKAMDKVWGLLGKLKTPWRYGGPMGRDIKPYKSPLTSPLTRGWGQPAVRNVTAVATAAAGGTLALSAAGPLLGWKSTKGDNPLPPASPDEPTTHSSPLSGTESALVGGTVGGLGSLLYGTLADKPDLRRDIIAMLMGGAVGGAYSLLTQQPGSKKPVKEVEAPVLDKDAAMPPWVGAVGAAGRGALRGALRFAGGPWVAGGAIAGGLGIKGYETYQIQKEQRRSNDLDRKLQQYYVDKQVEWQAEQKKHDEEALEAFKNKTTAMDNLTISQKAQRLGARGALAGGALGGLLSSAYGKGTDRERMRRDIISILGGAAIGGTVGVMSGDPRLIPDWAMSAADKVRSTADKVRSSVSDRLSPKV